jgi:hypothetical protein
MTSSSTSILFPPVNLPLTDETGNIANGWYRLFLAFYLRTGSAGGVSSSDLVVSAASAAAIANAAQVTANTALTAASAAETAVITSTASNTALIAAETAARIATNAVLESEIDAERSARVLTDSGLAAEIVARIAGDVTNANAVLAEAVARLAADTSLQTELTAETAARIAGDALAAHNYTYTQASAASIWIIVHNLGVYPSVSVADSAGTYVDGDISYDSINQATLTFSSAFAGQAYLV